MTRPYRIQIENGVYHITSRGNRKSKIFHGDQEYKKFLEYLKNAKEKYKICIYGYVLMSNHYHLLLETPQANLSSMMQYLNTCYTSYYNWKHKSTGHLFQGRYKSLLVDSEEYFCRLMRYIHLNPVKAKIVEYPEDYKWSSYEGEITRKENHLISYEERKAYLLMDKKSYKLFVEQGIDQEDKLFENVYGGFLLGGAKFIKEQLNFLKQQVEGEEYSLKKQIKNTIAIDEILHAVGSYYKEPVVDIINSKKCVKESKKVALYLSKRFTSYTNKQIGEKFSLGYSAVSKAYYSVERSTDRKLKKALKELISHFEV